MKRTITIRRILSFWGLILLGASSLFGQVKISQVNETDFSGTNLQIVMNGENEVGLLSYEYVVLNETGEKMFLLYLPKEDRSIDFSKAYIIKKKGVITFSPTTGVATLSEENTGTEGAIYISTEGKVLSTALENAPECSLKPYFLEDKRANEVEKYALVKIGNQVWLRENLRTKLFNDGSEILFVPEKKKWMALKFPAVTYYGGKETNRQKMGALYNWYAGTEETKLAPKGWKIPAVGDWEKLAKYIDPKGAMTYDMETSTLSYKAGELIKSETEWQEPPSPISGSTLQVGNNKTMLNLKAYGSTSTSKYFDGYSGIGRQGYFWTSTQSDYENTKGLFIRLFWDSQTINCSFEDKFMGYSVRCILDSSIKLAAKQASNTASLTIANTAGKLAEKLTEEQKQKVTNIIISGVMDARDFKTLRDITQIQSVTLDNVKIVAYRGKEGTLNGVKRYFAGEIPRESFKGLKKLTKFKATGEISSLGANCFEDCSALMEVSIPEGISEMGGSNFANCTALKKLQLPSTLTDLGMATFKGCSGLKEINIPTGVTSIDMEVFSGCSSLLAITIPENVESIGTSTFESCSSLSEVIIPNKVTILETFAFAKCSSLKKVTLGSELTEISYGAFLDDTILEDITLPEKLETIGGFAFQACRALKELTLPKSLKKLGNGVFRSTAITFTLPEGSNFQVKDHLLMSADGKAVYNLSTLYTGKIIVPEGVETIAGAAFADCNGLMQIDLPASLKEIKLIAMENTALYEIILRVNNPEDIKLGEDIFGTMDKARCELFVPDAAFEKYQQANVWKEFKLRKLSTFWGIKEVFDTELQMSLHNGILSLSSLERYMGKELRLYDLSGGLLHKEQILSDRQSFDLSSYNKGIYILQIASESLRIILD